MEQQYQILASGAETSGAFGLVACTVPPFSAGPALHRQGAALAGWYVVAGTLALTSGDATMVLRTGELQLLRPGAAHHCWNPSPVPARLLLLVAPGASAGELEALAEDVPGSGAAGWDTS